VARDRVEREVGRLHVEEVSATLDLVALQYRSEVGGNTGYDLVRFDGALVRHLDERTARPKALGTGFFVVAEGDNPGAPLSVYGAARGALRGETDASTEVVALDGGFLLRDKVGKRRSFRDDDFVAPAATYACDSLMPPLVLDGGRVFRMRGDGRDPIGEVRHVPGAQLLHYAGGVSAFASMNSDRSTLSVQFAAPDGGRVGRGFRDPQWTRVAGTSARVCALVCTRGCPKDSVGTCMATFVDFVCSDGRTVTERRYHRMVEMGPEATSEGEGPRELALTADARFLLFRDGPTLHRLDATTFAESELVSSYAFTFRDGDLPSVFGRPY
jgi:hypothetical protein